MRRQRAAAIPVVALATLLLPILAAADPPVGPPPPAALGTATPPSAAGAPAPAPSASAAGAPAPAPSAPGTPAPVPSSVPALAAMLPTVGTPVLFWSDKPLLSVYLATGAIGDTSPRYPDPFVKIGRTPVTTSLPPGVYTVTVESPDIPASSTVFRVGPEPVSMRVRGGNDGLRTLSTLLLAAGATAALAGLVIEVSYSPTPNGISKSKLAIPLFIVGGVGFGSGLGLYFASQPAFEQNGQKPDRRVSLGWRTQF